MADDHTGAKIYPMAGWNVGPLSDHDAIALQFQYLNMQTMERHESPFIAIPRAQLQELMAALTKALAKLDAVQAGPEGRTRQ